MEPERLGGLTEIARMLGVQPSAVANWRQREVYFPEPWGVWACGAVWVLEDVKTWHDQRPTYPRYPRGKRIVNELANEAQELEIY